jgi:predicted LPLAT superfamily acyltransferase
MTNWSQAPERGPAWIVHLMLWLMRHLGWFANRIVLPGITAWFFITSGTARAASREYLQRALGRPATTLDVLRHIHSFANSILDRALLLTGQADQLTLDVSGLEHVEAIVAAGRGCLLLGAHLGSFAILRCLAERCPVPVKILMYRANAGAYTTLMEQLDPGSASTVIPIGDIPSMLRVHEEVAAGSVVGILADRAPAGARQVTVPFFGRPAAFPVGPFVLAASLGVPVVLFRGVRVQNRGYEVAFTPFSDRVVLRRASREADLTAIIARYAQWLEQSCRAYPFNWFNFFAFWERAEHVSTKARPVVGSPPPAGRPLLGANFDPAA